MSRDRYRVTATCSGRPAITGWWDREDVARGKFRDWVSQYGSLPGARITLVDEEQAVTLTVWPEEA
ncbi:hypothetical protein PV387_03045 [Streptomyces sp. ME02-6987-2C]|uniref:hypothetical protein n=1 Tax=unclassified Streptomyces TaxID=2593676 RepID=UPI0029AA68D4|nr:MULTISPECIES: hypothetical protein [unclassified Streptomyces]MDX3365009.1 hypothetical protein [Streptomyces sp. ME02-6987-2C]MDX3420790.1 hypothetical protein [Streptomyces sp. ME02-6985-2c]